MSGQLIFFKKNKADYQNTNCVVTASEGSIYAPFVQRRRNDIGYMTTGSNDAANTTITVDFADLQTLTDILLIKHNFKAFTVKYWDGSAYQDFSTPIAQTVNTALTSRFSFNSVETTKIQVTITGTIVADAEKRICQIIATELIGQLDGWPTIKSPMFDKSRQRTKTPSGKMYISESAGGFKTGLAVKIWKSDTDLAIVENLYGAGSGFLYWPCGGVESQFSSSRHGYRLEDIFFMRCTNEHRPEWASGLYKSGMNIAIELAEVVF